VTIGIAANAVEPASVVANAGANMLWHALQDHGAMVRDSGGSGNTVIFQADQNVNPNDPLILGMDEYGAQIMAQTEILTNQGPNSINGGGAPIVPLDPVPGDAPVLTIAASQSSVTVSQSDISVQATAGAHLLFVTGSGDTLTLSGGTETITDTGTYNDYIVPAAGGGMLAFSSDILNGSDYLDLRAALAATQWNGTTAALGSYLHVTDTSGGATLAVSATASGSSVAVASVSGASSATLQTFLAHAIT
jgi:hypothetical protein